MPAIPNGLFWGFSGLAEVTIPTSVTSIGWRSFQGTENLQTIDIPDTVTSIDSSAFSGSGLTEVIVPSSVKSIGTYAFSSCQHLAKATLPNTLTTIADGMFSGSALEEFEMPDSLVTVYPEAFANCGSLERVSWNEKVQHLDDAAFKDCSSLTEVVLPGSTWFLGKSVFENCDALTKAHLTSFVTDLGSRAFADCDSLTDIKLGLGLTNISSEAFRHCDTLTSIIVPAHVEEIENNAFVECVDLREVTIPKATTEISDSAFSYPNRLTIYGVRDTMAETWAEDNGATFVSINKPASSAKLSMTEKTLFSGDEFWLYGEVEPLDCTDDISWKTSNAAVATINEEGCIDAYQPGTATIKFIAGEKVATCKITVVMPVDLVSVYGETEYLDCGDTEQLTARVEPSDAGDRSLEWTSSDTTVATVDQTGLVTALKAGRVTITATAKDRGTIFDSYDITVRDLTVATVVDELESAHPYANNAELAWRYSVAGASSLDVTFDERTMFEEDGDDCLTIYDAEGSSVGCWRGDELAGKTISVSGGTMTIRLTSDGAINAWGFKVVSVTPNVMTDLAGATVATVASQTYTGGALTPTVTVRLGGRTLVAGTDYVVSYKNNVNVGTATVTVTGKGNYAGTATGTFSIARAKVAAPTATNCTYNGKAQTGVAEGAGYALSGAISATNAGAYTATATPDANHCWADGTTTMKSIKWTIAKAAQPMKVKAAKRTAKASVTKKKAVTVAAPLKFTKKAQGTVTYARVAKGSDKCLTVNKKTGKVTIKRGTKKGTYKVKVKVSAKGNKNYKAGSKTITCTVVVK